MANILSAAEKAAKAAEMASRVKGLARAAELRAIASFGTRARVQGLARQAELDMKAKVSLANSGKAAHEGLSNTAKGARGRAFYASQKASKAKAAANAGSVAPKKTPTGLAAIPKGEVPGTGRGYTDVAGKGPKAPVLGKGGRNQVSPAGQSAYEKATGKSMFGPNGEGMPARQRSAWARKNQGR
jgi:hypothetical protein